MEALFREALHEPGGKGESSGPCWDQASFFFPNAAGWMRLWDRAASFLAMPGAAQALGWDGAGWQGQS